MNASPLPRRRTVQLTTRGRKTGQPRTVRVWYVQTAPDALCVQHSSAAPAHWYKNLLANPEVSVDFGSGPVAARAEPILEPGEIRDVLRRVRRKYPLAFVFQLLGRGRTPAVARITLEPKHSIG